MKKALEVAVAVAYTVVTYVLLMAALLVWIPQIPIGICVGIYGRKHSDQLQEIFYNGWQAAKKMPGVRFISANMFPKC